MKGWRTIAWNVLNAAVLAMDQVMSVSGTGYSIPNEWMPYWMMAYALVNVVLRYKTTTPVGKAND